MNRKLQQHRKGQNKIFLNQPLPFLEKQTPLTFVSFFKKKKKGEKVYLTNAGKCAHFHVQPFYNVTLKLYPKTNKQTNKKTLEFPSWRSG